MTLFKYAAASIAIFSTALYARPLPSATEGKLAASERLNPNISDEPTDFDFSGQIRFPGCSGSVVTFGQPATAKAVALTNGHCIGMMDGEADAIILNQPYVSSANLYIDRTNSFRTKTTRILYGIMQPHDIAFLELDNTYEELAAKGIRARPVAPEAVSVGTKIVLASGYWNTVAECDVEAIIFEVHEDKWVNKNSYKYHCEAAHGTSGSPLVNVATGEVVGANYTGNDDGESCTYNNPCEVDEKGTVTVDKGANYGDQISKVMGCLNQAKEIDVQVEGCLLPH
jgi:hypothetical protein